MLKGKKQPQKFLQLSKNKLELALQLLPRARLLQHKSILGQLIFSEGDIETNCLIT